MNKERKLDFCMCSLVMNLLGLCNNLTFDSMSSYLYFAVILMCWTFSEIQSLRWRNKRILKRIDLNVKKVQKTLNNDNETEIFSKFLRRIDSNVNAIKMTLGKIVE